MLAAPLHGQDTNAASTMAEQQGAEERYARLTADIQALQAANEALQNKIAGLQEEIRKLRDDQARQANNTGAQDDVRRLSDKIEAVDRRREEDKAAIAEQIHSSIAGLEKALAGGSSGPAHVLAPKPVVSAEPPPNVENGFVYTIKQGDSLSVILQAYNADFKSKGMKTISLKQARDANPNVDWNRLRVGQKIVIPRPAE